ncbi:substrate-binding periplasmic protein [Spartinivicinus poritis]|uniref:Transporter substrate-binding domain-containing protein n=1 Tax=Spartinivicinus poritis TaxID=2994640 RepID=A0ABT5UDV6_9GAMM|nr:transporter substrate-binding domain-containing protein [Spartinivicinus sp. A2-2]MDE1463663.1 transporter substrate-binding domain-containing protein [Spartinivicinus sp. A2-2]
MKTLISARKPIALLLKRIIYSVILLAYLSSSSAKELPTVTFTTGEWTPFISKKLTGYGVVTQIVTEACNRAGLKPIYTFMPWKRASENVKDGYSVATFSWNKTEKRMQDFLFSAYPVNKTPNVVFYKKSEYPKGVKFHQLSDLATYHATVAGIRGYWYEDGLKKHSIKLHLVNKGEQALGLLHEGRVQMYIDSLHVGLTDAKRVTPELVSNLGYTEYGSDDPYAYIMFSRTHKDTNWVKPRLDKALKSIYEDGTFDKILGTLLSR